MTLGYAIMNKIHILDETTINKIAAGEVIDRPASIVKELVENSLDAEANNIKIEIEDGGKRKIAIYDDGHGISRVDLPLALLRHATSKINSLEDIYATLSMGFRGEALASIRHVAEVKIISRKLDQDAYEIEANQDHVSELKPSARTTGTTIMVEYLFEKIPVRKKYLRSSTTEFSYIYDLVQKLALIYPEKNFVLIQDHKEVLNTNGLTDLNDLAVLFFGKELKGNLIKLDYEFTNFKCVGVVSNSLVSFSNKNKEIIAINKRIIKNMVIQKVISTCFQSVIPPKRFPLAIINLELPPKLIDVNIHPQKLDLKFLNSSFVFDNLLKVLRDALEINHGLKEEVDQGFINYYQDQEQAKFSTLGLFKPAVSREEAAAAERLYCSESKASISEDALLFEASNPQLRSNTFLAGQINETTKEALSKIEFFQIFNSFLVVNAWNAIWLIDQHAAHERLLFDYLRHKAKADFTKILLIPEVIELAPPHYDFIIKNLGVIKDLGFELDDFGSNQIVIREIPIWFNEVDLKDFFDNFIESLDEDKFTEMLEDNREKLHRKACKMAIKAGHKLSELEIRKLISDILNGKISLTCPHGRPFISKITKYDLEKMFSRR